MVRPRDCARRATSAISASLRAKSKIEMFSVSRWTFEMRGTKWGLQTFVVMKTSSRLSPEARAPEQGHYAVLSNSSRPISMRRISLVPAPIS